MTQHKLQATSLLLFRESTERSYAGSGRATGIVPG